MKKIIIISSVFVGIIVLFFITLLTTNKVSEVNIIKSSQVTDGIYHEQSGSVSFEFDRDVYIYINYKPKEHSNEASCEIQNSSFDVIKVNKDLSYIESGVYFVANDLSRGSFTIKCSSIYSSETKDLLDEFEIVATKRKYMILF